MLPEFALKANVGMEFDNKRRALFHHLTDDFIVTNGGTDSNVRHATRKVKRHVSVVQCERYRCLAYQDEGGQWRNDRTDELLPPVRQVVLSFDLAGTRAARHLSAELVG